MKSKKFLIVLLLVSFCGGEKTQAEICENYWFYIEYEVDSKLEKLLADIAVAHYSRLQGSVSEGISYSQFNGEFPNRVEGLIETISKLKPDESNLLNHKRIINSLNEIKTDLSKYVLLMEESETDSMKFLDLQFSIQDSLYFVYDTTKQHSCPTD